jgi:hypothetical protein
MTISRNADGFIVTGRRTEEMFIYFRSMAESDKRAN